MNNKKCTCGANDGGEWMSEWGMPCVDTCETRKTTPTNTQQRAEELILRNNARRYPFSGPAGTAKALAEAGLLMPDPAKPAVTSIEGHHTYHPWAIWHAEGLTINRDHEGTIYIDDEAGRNISMSPEQARALIAALLAADNHAEQEQSNE